MVSCKYRQQKNSSTQVYLIRNCSCIDCLISLSNTKEMALTYRVENTDVNHQWNHQWSGLKCLIPFRHGLDVSARVSERAVLLMLHVK